MVTSEEIQSLCERGSERLVATDYVAAERALAQAEEAAVAVKDFDTLSRLYYPLQEARRQIRGRCLEGGVRFLTPDKLSIDLAKLAEQTSQGSVLVAGLGGTGAAEELRRICRERGSYIEVILGVTAKIVGGSTMTFATPLFASIPAVEPLSPDEVVRRLPAHSVLVCAGPDCGSSPEDVPATVAGVMSLWEHLHLPFLAAADAMPTSELKLQAYRRVIEVDYACELAHQKAAGVARELARQGR